FSAINLDIKNIRKTGDILPESFDQVVVNPPYRKTAEGRHSSKQDRNVACFEQETGLADFVRAAAYSVKNRGRVNCIYPAESEMNLLQLLLEFRLEPKRMLYVHSRSGDPAGFVLLEAVKNGGRGLTVHPPLFLYSGRENAYSGEALEFCPFLECNSGER
ncbi:MAG: methyltransferase, partial [Thermodesulfobacteriota bacterium]